MAVLVQVGEGAHGAAAAAAVPAKHFGAARRVAIDRLHELGAIRLVAPHAARRRRPVEALHRSELMLAGELPRVHAALDVLHARDLHRDRICGERARLDARVVVGRPVEQAVERDARALADHRAEVRQSAPQDALARRRSGEAVDLDRLALRRATIGERANLPVLQVRAGRDRTRRTDIRCGARRGSDRCRRPTATPFSSGAPVAIVGVHEFRNVLDQEVHVALVEIDVLEVAEAANERRQVALVVDHARTPRRPRRWRTAGARRSRRASSRCRTGRRSMRVAGNSFVLMSTERAAEVALLIGGEGLRRRDRLDETRREHVERYDALLRLGARHARAVEGARRVALAEAAHEDVLAVLHRDAAHALHRLRRVAVGALRDLLGGDRVDDARPRCAAASSASLTVPRSREAVTTCASSWTVAAVRLMFCSSDLPAVEQKSRDLLRWRSRSGAPGS